MKQEILSKQASAWLPTEWGTFNVLAYAESPEERMPQLALLQQDFNPELPAYVRIHSECLTGDVFHSEKCDCGKQLQLSMDYLTNRNGVLIYLRQEGRGIGLINKLKAYELQDQGMNTIEANLHLGLKADDRRYDLAVQILIDLGIHQLWLLTNNPAKIRAIDESGLELLGRIPVLSVPTIDNALYLKVKQDQMGHILNLHQ
ncbi:MAG: GTP cyclohydrolase II [Saprospiraceae bacterium]